MAAVALRACPCAPFDHWALARAVFLEPEQLICQWHWKPLQRSDLAELAFIRLCSAGGNPLVAQAAAMVEEGSAVELTVIGNVARLVYSGGLS